MKHSRWTETENDLLREKFPIMPTVDLVPLFPSHTLRSINSQANDLGLKKTDEYRKQYLAENRIKAIEAMQGGTPWNKHSLIEKICPTCGISFTVSGHTKNQTYCSKKCVHKWLETTSGETHWHYRLVERTCQWCGETFKAKPAEIAQGHALFCSRRCQGSYTTYTIGGKRSSLEIAIEEVLTALNESFESQKQIGYWLVDFYLPNRNLVIECDGIYWHGLPEVIKRDKNKDAWLKKHGYQILRLGEKAIKENATQALKDGLQ